jgi:formate-dependent nitrite reductase membrane component NrfD
MSVRYTSSTGQVSVNSMLQGKWSSLFWIAVVILGMVIPLAAVINSIVAGLEGISMTFLYAAIFSGLIGDLAMRYLILRCGVYGPLIPSTSYA